MSSKRYFTKKELEEMGRRTLDVLKETIDAGNKKKAKELAERMYSEFSRLHDGYMCWVTGLQSFIYKNQGIEALEKAEREAHTIESNTAWKAPAGAPLPKTDFRSRVESMVGGLRGHLQPITIKEDDEKVTITMEPCGSGERIIQKGWYEAGLCRVKESHRITWGLNNFPIYCVHCPIMEALDIENTGDFTTSHFISDPIGKEHCRFVIYKDNKDIPEEFYKRIGKKKPTGTKK
jgi:hypothetical protein